MEKVNIYDDIVYGEEKVKVSPILETEFSKEIRIVFKKDQIMKDHKTAYPITVEIFEGSIDFGVGEKVYNLVKGDIVSLEASIVHNLKANEDSIVRLTLSKSDSINRVKGVLKL
ncbi:cupin [Arcobacter sp. YIC-310]|uniref:cupin n=1 Tax=Arcobacter sp. YIC-310 TaxID=3376632 RepID=UPI003C2711BF